METWYIDCEFGFRDRRVDCESAWAPVVFCAVAARSGERHFFWHKDDRLAAFVASHADDLFVSHVNSVEMKFLIRLGIQLPRRWFDTCTAWRRVYNEPNHLEASLIHCLSYLGEPHLALLDKEIIRNRILYLDFDWGNPTDREEINNYCFGDCDGCGLLYRHLHDKINTKVMDYWCEYAKAISSIELRGIPFDFMTTNLIWLSGHWICEDFINQVNHVYPIFVGTSFKCRAFFKWLNANNIAWPWKKSETTGRMVQSLDQDTMEDMEGRHPFIRRVRQVLRTYESFYERRPLKVDGTSRRHYFSTWPFRSITGRNQPRNFVFSGPKWLRYLIVPESPNYALSYIDFKAEEVGIAASLSDDANMREMYRSRDAHLWFAIADGAVPPDATKKTHPEIRAKYKTVNLGVLYGQTAYGISHRLGVTIDEAGALFKAHRQLFPQYWSWSRRVVQAAYDRGEIRTKLGWGCRVPPHSKKRTWMNWPIQSAGGDIMRLTVIYLERLGVRVLAPVHDGFLCSGRLDQVEDSKTDPGEKVLCAELQGRVDRALRTAAVQVLGEDLLRWDVKVYTDRFRDGDGKDLWDFIVQALQKMYRNVRIT